MADSAQGSFKGDAPKTDTSPQAKTEGDHCPHCADHHARIGALEAKLGVKPQPGAASEETASSASRTEKARERKRH